MDPSFLFGSCFTYPEKQMRVGSESRPSVFRYSIIPAQPRDSWGQRRV